MGKLSYQSLYSMVVSEIEARTTYSTKANYSGQLKRDSIAPLAGNAISDITSASIVQSMQTLLSEIIHPRIISGLEVKATTPSTGSVIISPGKGVSYGRLYELKEQIIIPIPFDNKTEVFYIVLFDDGIMIDRVSDFKKLVLAKIIVPKPGTTLNIIDDKSNDYDAYIVNQKEYHLYGDSSGFFEEETLELLRDNMSPILADNLIGNIRLTENLKVINNSGSIELNSRELLIFDEDENRMAKFNRNGTFFYDTDGREVAKFSVDGAKVGNINIEKNKLRSGNFISESRGFEIRDDGYAEFQDVRVRGRIASSVFEYDKISAVGGKLFVGNSTVLSTPILASDTTITVDSEVFSDGDIVILKDGINEEYMLISSLVSGTTYNVTRDLASAYSTNPTWEKGTAVVSTGNGTSGSLGGFIMMDAVSQYSPFIDINERNSDIYNDYSVKVRLGNLAGISDPLYGALSGYGLFAENVYLKGKMYSPDIKTGISGARVELNSNGLIAYNSGDGIIFQMYTSGENAGDILIGNDPSSGGKGLLWDSSAETLCLDGSMTITGTLSADCIDAGTLCLEKGITIKSNPYESGASGYTTFDGEGVKSYDSEGNLKFCLVDGHIEARDIRLQDPTCVCCYSYLDAGALKFHDECGDVPYVKRICSGESATGTTVRLPGWKTPPKVMVGVKSLYSYEASKSAQSQQWCVYVDDIHCYCDSGDIYGYEFDVHAELRLAEGSGIETTKEIVFGQCFCTAACTCATCVKSRFQLWCNNIAPSNYYYGVLCYALCYRKLGDTPWCASCFTYTQPHANTSELKTTTTDSQLLTFPCMATWEITGTQVSLTFTDSGLSSSTVQYCLCQRALTNTLHTYCVCMLAPNSEACTLTYSCVCCNAVTVAGLVPSNVYCTYLCVNYCSVGTSHNCVDYCKNGSNCGCICAKVCTKFCFCNDSYVSAGPICACTTSVGIYCCQSCSDNCSLLWDLTPSGGAYDTALFCTRVNLQIHPGTWTQNDWARAFTCLCLYSSNLYHCYCSTTGEAACCLLECSHSVTDIYGCSCILDPGGTVNWLAIAYS